MTSEANLEKRTMVLEQTVAVLSERWSMVSGQVAEVRSDVSALREELVNLRLSMKSVTTRLALLATLGIPVINIGLWMLARHLVP